ncbi:MAG TPA: adenylate/guanylate cyclase domain-containing protein, partial [Anaerolineales bacterium]|nr:adenylate/guanylate cyclase domain-containing protein [Anaerolineales bacterium]
MSALPPYLPQDRLRALARGETLPNRTTGSALFADISGFTPLTEKLTRELGARRGAEELTHQINAVYDALIAEIEKHGGSVINFAGDAITCWFDAGDGTRAPAQAVACALALQATMLTFPALALKVAVTTGEARRFIVGDPTIQLLDTLAGATIARL